MSPVLPSLPSSSSSSSSPSFWSGVYLFLKRDPGLDCASVFIVLFASERDRDIGVLGDNETRRANCSSTSSESMLCPISTSCFEFDMCAGDCSFPSSTSGWNCKDCFGIGVIDLCFLDWVSSEEDGGRLEEVERRERVRCFADGVVRTLLIELVSSKGCVVIDVRSGL